MNTTIFSCCLRECTIVNNQHWNFTWMIMDFTTVFFCISLTRYDLSCSYSFLDTWLFFQYTHSISNSFFFSFLFFFTIHQVERSWCHLQHHSQSPPFHCSRTTTRWRSRWFLKEMEYDIQMAWRQSVQFRVFVTGESGGWSIIPRYYEVPRVSVDV